MSKSENVEQIREQFTRQAEAYAKTQQAKDEVAHRALVAISGVGDTDRVLDVACGPGFLTLAFAAASAETTGLDATPALLDHARGLAKERGVGNVRFELGDATALPFEDGCFDVAVSRAAFHHFPEPLSVLREMRRVVREGGRILVADLLTSDDPEQAAYHHRLEQLCDPTHVRALSTGEFRGLFDTADLVVEAWPRTTLDYDLEEWIGHGGPDAATTEEIRGLFESCLEEDRSGLNVRRESGRLAFTHQACLVLARRPAG